MAADRDQVMSIRRYRDIVRRQCRQILVGEVAVGGLTVEVPTKEGSSPPSYGFNPAPPRSYGVQVPPFGTLTLYASYGVIHQVVDIGPTHEELQRWGYQGGLEEFTAERLGFTVASFNTNIWLGIVVCRRLAQQSARSATTPSGETIGTASMRTIGRSMNVTPANLTSHGGDGCATSTGELERDPW